MGLRGEYDYLDGMVAGSTCDGCGECVFACPSGIFEIVGQNGLEPKAIVREVARKRLSTLCLGRDLCKGKIQANCMVSCPNAALSLSW